MSTSLLELNRQRYPVGHLFGGWADANESPTMSTDTVAKSKRKRSHSQAQQKLPPAAKPPLRVSVHGGSQGRGDAEQQVRTVREVLLARLDDIGATSLWPIAEDCGLSHQAFLQMYQRMLLVLFPDECGDGEAYVPDPAERLEMPPAGAKVRKGGLFPYPCEGVGDERSLAFARHLLIGEQSPIAGMKTVDGQPMFDAAELARLGERKRMREESGRAEVAEVAEV